MTIKELEKQLDVPRATIRFYEKEQFINPARGNNNYRDYSDEDIAILMKVIIFRKLGISLDDIHDVLDGVKPLENVVDDNIKVLQEQIRELEGAIKLSQLICAKKESIQSFNEQYYWNNVLEEEKQGDKFVSLAKDIVKYEKKLVLDEFGLADSEGNLRVHPVKAVIMALWTCVIIGVVVMFIEKTYSVEQFFKGAILPFELIVFGTIIGLPVYLIGRKNPELAKALTRMGRIIAFVLVIVILLLFITDLIWG